MLLPVPVQDMVVLGLLQTVFVHCDKSISLVDVLPAGKYTVALALCGEGTVNRRPQRSVGRIGMGLRPGIRTSRIGIVKVVGRLGKGRAAKQREDEGISHASNAMHPICG